MEVKKYQIIYADPPWKYESKTLSGTMKGNATDHYKTMTNEDICNLKVNEIADSNCILFLWATMPLLPNAFKVIEAWGFIHKTTAFTWIKLNPKSKTVFKGIGRWVMGNAELVLLATKGKPHRIAKNISQIIMENREGHSKKPDIVRNKIVELMGDLPRIELFARNTGMKDLFGNNPLDGWDAWGNEVESDIQL